jgi:cytochrome c peroxidase
MPAPSTADALIDTKADLVADGKELFFASETGCASCHAGGNGTDANKHDLGTRVAGDTDDKFDTPTLHFVAGTAPYFHDGRYDTLLELLTASDSQMGHSLQLSRSEAKALAAYLETL